MANRKVILLLALNFILAPSTWGKMELNREKHTLNLKLAPFLKDLMGENPSCALQFIEFDPILDFSLFLPHWPSVINSLLDWTPDESDKKRTIGISKPENTTKARMSLLKRQNHQPIEHPSRRRTIFSFINIVLTSEETLEHIKSYDQTVVWKSKFVDRVSEALTIDLHQMMPSLLYGGEFLPSVFFERFAMHLFVLPDDDDYIVDKGGVVIRYALNRDRMNFSPKAPIFLLQYQNQNQNEKKNVKLSSDLVLTKGLVFCPECFEANSKPQFGFPFTCPNKNQGEKSPPSSCYKIMINLHETIKLRHLEIMFLEDKKFDTDDPEEVKRLSFSLKVPLDPKKLYRGDFYTPFHRKGFVSLRDCTKFALFSTLNITLTRVKGERLAYALPNWKDLFSSIVYEEEELSTDSNRKFVGFIPLKRTHVFTVGGRFFKFITTNKVQRLNRNLDIYLKPFTSQVWIGLFTSLLILTKCFILIFGLHLVIFSFNSGRISIQDSTKISLTHQIKKLGDKIVSWSLNTFFWIWRALLEQCDEELPPLKMERSETNQMDSREAHQKSWKNISRIMTSLFLCMAVILTNAYRGIIKSEYTVGHPYKTEWKYAKEFLQMFDNLPLDQIQDQKDKLYNGSPQVFSIFYTLSTFSCSLKKETATSSFYYLDWEKDTDFSEAPFYSWKLFFEVLDYATECRPNCPGNERVPFSLSNCTQIEHCVKYARMKIFFHKTWLTCPQKIPQLIRDRLSKTQQEKSVLIVPQEDFSYYWNFFKTEMKQNRSMAKFGHNMKVKDSSIKQTLSYLILDDIDFHYPGIVSERMHRLLSSGLYWLWAKWDTIRFGPSSYAGAVKGGEGEDSGKESRFYMKQYEEETPEFIPLSFGATEVHLVFLFWLYCGLISTGILVLEFSWNFYPRIIKAMRQLLKCIPKFFKN